uniref:NADH-ubiquinone oxidoreductase chain 6 n=1 Tax=Lachesilla pedicularia TaxID=1897924 RepID=A0A8K1ZFT3_9NEOP|nr:NADH dehydrogenase subunit 6 [Lachesilla pedicularia]
MYTFMIATILFSLLFIVCATPLSMGLTLLLQTIILSIFLASSMKSSWFLYIFVLIFIGGMLILFIYVTSIFPNEKFKFNQINIYLFTFLLTITSILLFSYFWLMNITPFFFETQSNNSMMESFSLFATKKIFSSQTNLMMIFLVNYLFFCMIVVIKITNFSKGPLRKMNYV